MKKFTLLFFGLFFIGFGIKLFHIHYNAVIMLIGLGGILVTSLVALSRAEERKNGLLHLALNEIDEDFLTLDKYSWFLYANGEAEKALQVSDRALEMAQKTSQQDPIDFVRQHNEAIRLRSWEHYRLEHTAH